MSRALALTAIGTQLILGLVLVAILITLQDQAPPKPYGCYDGTVDAAGQLVYDYDCTDDKP